MARKDKAGLYIDTQNLFAVLYQAQFELPKRDRPVIVNRMLGRCEAIIGYFALAYQREQKEGYIDSFIAEFEALKVICRFVIDNLLNNEKTKFKIREQIARIDEGVERWRRYIKGTRQEYRTCGGISPDKHERSAESHLDL